MPIDFFQKEFEKVAHRFNEVYGARQVFDRSLKRMVFMSIVALNLLKRQAIRTKDKIDIQNFVRRRDIINGFLDYAEAQFRVKEDAKAVPEAGKEFMKSTGL